MTLASPGELRDRLEAQGITRGHDARRATWRWPGTTTPSSAATARPGATSTATATRASIGVGRIRTRDELQARMDLANLARRRRACEHPHQLARPRTDVVFEIASSQTFYDDETPWGPDASATWPQAIQDGTWRP